MTRYRTIVADPPWDQGERPGWSWREGRPSGEVRDLPYATMTLDEIAALPVAAMAEPDAHLYLWTTSTFLRDAFDTVRVWGFDYSATLVWCKPSRGFSVGGAFQNNVEFVLFCRRPGTAAWREVLEVTTALADAADQVGVTRADVDRALGTSDMGGWWLSRLEHRCAVPTDEQWPRLKTLLGLGDELDAQVREINERKGTGRPTQAVTSRWFQWPRGAHSAKPEAFLDIVEQVSPGPYLEMFARRARFGWDYWGDESLGTAEVAA